MQLRWPQGFVCPRCGGRRARPSRRGLLRCGQCDYQASVTAGTIFQDTRLPLRTWFRTITPEQDSDNGYIYSTVTLQVSHAIPSNLAGGSYQFRMVGGELNGKRLHIAGLPRFQVGQDVVLFLNSQPAGVFGPTVGLWQGVFFAERDEATGRADRHRSSTPTHLGRKRLPLRCWTAKKRRGTRRCCRWKQPFRLGDRPVFRPHPHSTILAVKPLVRFSHQLTVEARGWLARGRSEGRWLIGYAGQGAVSLTPGLFFWPMMYTFGGSPH